MKNFKKAIILVTTYLVVIGLAGLISAYSIGRSMGAPITITGTDTGIDVSPVGGKIFDLANLYPGKEEVSTVVIDNHGEDPFTVDITVNLGGDQVLIDALWLKISDALHTYYQGPLAGASATIVQVPPGSSTELDLSLTMLTGQGNVTQNKSVDMNWSFAAATLASPGPGPGVGPGVDPGTGDVEAVFSPPEGPETAPEGEPAGEPATVPAAAVLLAAPEEAQTEGEDEIEAIPAEVEEITLPPEEPQVEPVADMVELLAFWPLLLLLLPLLLWFLFSSTLRLLVPDGNGKFKVVSRRIARYKQGKWHTNIGKELTRHLPEKGLLIVDFRGGFLKEAGKHIYSGEKVIASGSLRYAVFGKDRFVSWTDDLKQRSARMIG